MWEIYDALISGIPKDYLVEELICGTSHAIVRSGEGAGLGPNRPYETRLPMFAQNLLGLPLREVANCVKSWNYVEASIGLAAINAYYNNPQVAREHGVMFSDNKRVEDRLNDPFIMSQNEVKGKRVGVVGHFPHLESLLEPICDLAILEWSPLEGDYPLPASEFILPECDYVFISCICLVDKTLPRLLELSRKAKRVTMVGPGTPLAPVLFDYGIQELSGFLIKDNAKALRIIAGAEKVKIYTTGQKVSFKK